jgi:hypothetical protein
MNPTRGCATYNIMTYFNIRSHLRIDVPDNRYQKVLKSKGLSSRPAIVFEEKKE